MKTIQAYITGGILLALLAAWIASGFYIHHKAWDAGAASVQTKLDALNVQLAQERERASEDARAKEQAQAKQLAAIDAQHVREMKDAQANFDRTLAEQRAGTLQLRQRWLACTSASANVPTTPASASSANAAADDRAASAARIVRAAAEADATIRALQAIVRSDRGESEAQDARSKLDPLHP